MILYRLLSVLFFILRFRLRPRSTSVEIGLGALRQLYLNKHKPFFKCDEESLLKPFKWLLHSAKDEDGDYLFFINPNNTLPPDKNSQESLDALQHYDLLPPL